MDSGYNRRRTSEGEQEVPSALYRKYRSKSLDEIVGQDHIRDVLAQALSKGRTTHAYLLTGPRGVGKTSIARILAHEINNLPYTGDENHLDIIEIDAASNNGVEDVRDLREKVRLAPVSALKKVYIIDEVHMLSKAAFNALLKTLEEPPEHVVFILATTDAEKLPDTIISRTQRFGFRLISEKDAVKHLGNIAKKEKINITNEALSLIAERGEGSFRDSIGLLDQLASLADEKDGITVELIEHTLGLAPKTALEQLLQAIENHDINTVTKTLDRLSDEGIDSTVLSSQLMGIIRRNIAESPSLLPVLDGLLDVARSSRPALKLLCVLSEAALSQPAPKEAALSVPVREVKASVLTLQQPDTPAPKPKTKAKNQGFNWKQLIEYTQKHHVAFSSVLSKCGHDLDDTKLTLYTGNRFYKNKLDSSRYRQLMQECLQATGFNNIDVHTLPTTPPLKDSQAAAVAVIMGGGEEVQLEPR